MNKSAQRQAKLEAKSFEKRLEAAKAAGSEEEFWNKNLRLLEDALERAKKLWS